MNIPDRFVKYSEMRELLHPVHFYSKKNIKLLSPEHRNTLLAIIQNISYSNKNVPITREQFEALKNRIHEIDTPHTKGLLEKQRRDDSSFLNRIIKIIQNRWKRVSSSQLKQEVDSYLNPIRVKTNQKLTDDLDQFLGLGVVSEAKIHRSNFQKYIVLDFLIGNIQTNKIVYAFPEDYPEENEETLLKKQYTWGNHSFSAANFNPETIDIVNSIDENQLRALMNEKISERMIENTIERLKVLKIIVNEPTATPKDLSKVKTQKAINKVLLSFKEGDIHPLSKDLAIERNLSEMKEKKEKEFFLSKDKRDFLQNLALKIFPNN